MTEDGKPTIHAALVTEIANFTSNAVAISKVNLSRPLLCAAARFSREVGRLEREHAGKMFGEFWGDIFQHAIASVLTTVASLEAYVNELFSDRDTIFPGYSTDLLSDLWETYERKPMLGKFDFALRLLHKPALNGGARPRQDIQVLVKLRDALMHFKPEWENEADQHKDLSEKLHSKIGSTPFLPEPELLFPRRWASHSCTAWAVHSAIAFIADFEQTAGLSRAKYDVGDPRLKP